MRTIVCAILIALISIFFFVDDPPKKIAYSPENIPAPDNALEYPPRDATHHGQGLYSQVITAPIDPQPLDPLDIIEVSYIGWNQSTGKNIDATTRHGKFMRFRVDMGGKHNPVIEGWQRMLPQMRLGETRRVWIPAALAYGDTPRSEDSGGNLVFDLTIENVERAVRPPRLSRYPEQPPSDALTLPNGLKYLTVLENEEGSSPKATDNVIVDLSMWNESGRLFRSTEVNKRPLQLDIAKAIPAFRDSLPSMKVGETRRLWITPDLAYGDSPPLAFPKGNWIADLTLKEISEPLEPLTPPKKSD